MLRFAANLTLLFNEVPFLERFEAAARCGFREVEFHFPYAHPAAELKARLETNGQKLVLHNLPSGDWEAGERGIACLPDRVVEFRAGVAKAIDYASALGVTQVNCLAGKVPAGADPAVTFRIFVDNLRYAASELDRHGIRLLIEPVNTRDIPGFYLCRSRQAVEVIEAVGSDNLFLLCDIYHLQAMEGDLARTLERLMSRIGHVQVADSPGRHEPGTGEIHFAFLFDELERLGYAGSIGCEYKPLGRTQDGLAWLRAAQLARAWHAAA